MSYQRDRLGSSGVFKVIVDVSRKIKRAISEGEKELGEVSVEMINLIAQAFIAGRFGDVHAMGTAALQQATRRDRFEASWSEAIQPHRPLTGFQITDMGQIDLAFIPGLEEVPQTQFVAFVEIAFSGIDVPFSDERALTIGAVLLDDGGVLRIGALHKR